jgi:hypothetical protein
VRGSFYAGNEPLFRKAANGAGQVPSVTYAGGRQYGEAVLVKSKITVAISLSMKENGSWNFLKSLPESQGFPFDGLKHFAFRFCQVGLIPGEAVLCLKRAKGFFQPFRNVLLRGCNERVWRAVFVVRMLFRKQVRQIATGRAKEVEEVGVPAQRPVIVAADGGQSCVLKGCVVGEGIHGYWLRSSVFERERKQVIFGKFP